MSNYYAVVLKPSKNKNEEEPLKTEKEFVFLTEDNESNDNDSTVITTIQLEKGTILGLNTVAADEGKDLGLGMTKAKNKEEVESSSEEDEDEDGSPNKINSEIKNNCDQEYYFDNRTEETTNMEADTEKPM